MTVEVLRLPVALAKSKRKPEALLTNARAQEILARSPAARAAHQTVNVRDIDGNRKAWRE